MDTVTAADTVELQKMFISDEDLSFLSAKCSIMSDDITTNPHLLENQKIFMESHNFNNNY